MNTTDTETYSKSRKDRAAYPILRISAFVILNDIVTEDLFVLEISICIFEDKSLGKMDNKKLDLDKPSYELGVFRFKIPTESCSGLSDLILLSQRIEYGIT